MSMIVGVSTDATSYSRHAAGTGSREWFRYKHKPLFGNGGRWAGESKISEHSEDWVFSGCQLRSLLKHVPTQASRAERSAYVEVALARPRLEK